MLSYKDMCFCTNSSNDIERNFPCINDLCGMYATKFHLNAAKNSELPMQWAEFHNPPLGLVCEQYRKE